MTLREQFRVAFGGPIYASQPITSLQSSGAPVDLTTEISGLEWTTQLPGGFGSARVTLSLPNLRRRFPARSALDIIRPFGDVTITAPRGALATVFRGRVMGIQWAGGWPSVLTVVGYGVTGLTDAPYASVSGGGTTAGSIMADVLAKCCPTLSLGTIVDTGVLHAPAEYQYLMPDAIVGALTKEGGIPSVGSGAALWDFLAYRQGPSGALLADFLPRVAPLQALYQVPIDDTLDWTDDYTEAYGVATVRYGVASATAGTAPTINLSTPAVSNAFTNAFGIARAVMLDGGTQVTAGANMLASSYLTFRQLGVPQIVVTRDMNRGLELIGGGEKPAYLVHAGEWASFGNATNQPTVQATYERGPYICTATHMDAKSGQATFTFNQSPRNGVSLLLELYKTAVHTARLTSPVSGLRTY